MDGKTIIDKRKLSKNWEHVFVFKDKCKIKFLIGDY